MFQLFICTIILFAISVLAKGKSSTTKNQDQKINIGNIRTEGIHTLSSKDVKKYFMNNNHNNNDDDDDDYALITEFFYGGIKLVNLKTGKVVRQIVTSSNNFQGRGTLGVNFAGGYIISAGGGPLVGTPFEVYLFDPMTGDVVATCKPDDDDEIIEEGLFNDIEIVDNDKVYVTDSTMNRLWSFKIHDASKDKCQLKYVTLDEDIFLGTQDTPIRANGIVSYGNGFIIATFQTGGLFYYNAEEDTTLTLVPEGDLELADGLEIVQEDDGKHTLYVTEGADRISVFRISKHNGQPRARLIGRIVSNYYAQPATSAVSGNMLYTANLGPNTDPFPAVGEDDPDTFDTNFAVIGTNRFDYKQVTNNKFVGTVIMEDGDELHHKDGFLFLENDIYVKQKHNGKLVIRDGKPGRQSHLVWSSQPNIKKEGQGRDYYSRLQGNCNLVTRKGSTGKSVWKSDTAVPSSPDCFVGLDEDNKFLQFWQGTPNNKQQLLKSVEAN